MRVLIVLSLETPFWLPMAPDLGNGGIYCIHQAFSETSAHRVTLELGGRDPDRCCGSLGYFNQSLDACAIHMPKCCGALPFFL